MTDKVQTVGPFGGEGSLLWDDGAYSTVREIVVYASSVIESIEIEYDDNGSSVWAQKHGYSEDGNKNTVSPIQTYCLTYLIFCHTFSSIY